MGAGQTLQNHRFPTYTAPSTPISMASSSRCWLTAGALLLAACCVTPAHAVCTGKYCDVNGNTMAKCDRSQAHDPNPNYQSTGYFRDNYCTASSSDAGSHYVCVELPNDSVDGQSYSPFWTITGQASSPREAVTWPKPGPWCICMWASARMLEANPEFWEMFTCEATNEWVVEDYNVNVTSQCKALHTVCEKCATKSTAVKDSLREKCATAALRCGQSVGPGSPPEL